jgi:hypothetical protein
MDIREIEQVLEVFDKITQLDNPDAIMSSISIVREKLGGNLPSIVIKQLFVLTGEQIKELQTEKEELIAKLSAGSSPTPINGFYEFKAFLMALQVKMGGTYGWRTDCVTASANSPDCKAIRNEDIQKWIKDQLVPDWAYEQVSRLVFQKRTGAAGREWKNTEYEYLGGIYCDDPTTKNTVLAAMCSEKFGREITENAIKGALDRLRKQGKIPARRPKKMD